jgi:hypothetical protein
MVTAQQNKDASKFAATITQKDLKDQLTIVATDDVEGGTQLKVDVPPKHRISTSFTSLQVKSFHSQTSTQKRHT